MMTTPLFEDGSEEFVAREVADEIAATEEWMRTAGIIGSAGHLDGSTGLNRPRDTRGNIKPSQISANTDTAAIAEWLCTKHNLSTRQSYRKEALRLWCWSRGIRGKALSDLFLEDLIAYDKFLRKIPNEWLGHSARLRRGDGSSNPEWRPFSKQLTKQSRVQAFTILACLFAWLINSSYLATDPIAMLTSNETYKNMLHQNEQVRRQKFKTKDLNHAQMTVLWEVAIEKRPFERWLVALIRFAGLRIEEIATHNMSNFREKDGLWFLDVLGQGGRHRAVPILDPLFEELWLFRMSHNWPPRPQSLDEAEKGRPLIPGRGGRPMSKRRLARVFKCLAYEAGARMAESDPVEGKQLMKASPSWLRHRFIRVLLESGVDLSDVKAVVGQTNYFTTFRYRQTVEKRTSHFPSYFFIKGSRH